MTEGRLLHTLDEVAVLLRVSERTVRRLVARGELRVKHVGRKPLVTDRELAAFLARGDRKRVA